MRLLSIIILLYLTNNINCQNKSNIKFKFQMYPSFHEGFQLNFDVNRGEIEIQKQYKLYFADSIDNNGFIKLTDKSLKEKVRDLIPTGLVVSKKLSLKDSIKLHNIFSTLMDFPKSDDNISGEDGITILILELKGNKIVKSYKVWSPPVESEIGGIIIELNDLLSSVFKDYSEIIDLLEDNMRYIDKRPYIVKSLNPLYIKLLSFPNQCNSFEHEITYLPKAEEIYVDLTNYEGEDNNCIKTIFKNKYLKVIWVLDGKTNKYHFIFDN